MITSSSNAQVKNIIQLNTKAKVRKEQQLFVVEGMKMFQEAPACLVEKVFVSESFVQQHGDGISFERYSYEVVADKVFKTMSDTQTPQGILCVMRQEAYKFEEVIDGMNNKRKPLLLILEDLQDPGNVGTIFRTAEGAGVTGILLTKGCVDIYNPKTIRSTMGSIYRMPFLYIEDIDETVCRLKQNDIRTYGAHLNGKNTYDQEDYQDGTAFFIGNEGNGLSDELSNQADCLVKIPMQGQLESLNAAMAAGILMYEAARQRR